MADSSVMTEVASVIFRCTNCGDAVELGPTELLGLCPKCGSGQWEADGEGDVGIEPFLCS